MLAWGMCCGKVAGAVGRAPLVRSTSGWHGGEQAFGIRRGHERWTLRLLAGKVVELGLASSMSHEGVRKRLKKTLSSRGRRRNGAFPR